uniref:Bm14143 n=1 Tax=Brugia malayi TaxID=6279 RepID=A0A1I9G0J0_BRUMA|nr:Bm14143 [Brugia malayi]
MAHLFGRVVWKKDSCSRRHHHSSMTIGLLEAICSINLFDYKAAGNSVLCI